MPVVAVEQMSNVDVAAVGPRARIAIIYNPEPNPELPYLGIHIQDIPRAYLAEAESMESSTNDGLIPYLLSRVDDDEDMRFIPDLDRIIGDLGNELNQLSPGEFNR